MVRGTGRKTGDWTQWVYLRRYYSLDCSLWRFGWDFCMHLLIHSGVSEGLPKVSSFPVGTGLVPVWHLSQRPPIDSICQQLQFKASQQIHADTRKFEESAGSAGPFVFVMALCTPKLCILVLSEKKTRRVAVLALSRSPLRWPMSPQTPADACCAPI